MAKPTIKDIAKECNVSLSTVSLVLNNNPRISEKTRTKVLEAVARHGYQPNVHARGLASRSSQAISVVVPNVNHIFADIYFGEIVSGIYERASDQGYKVLLDIANKQFIQTKEYLSLLKSKRVDGLLFIAASLKDDYLKDFVGEPCFISVNHYFPDTELNYIAVDYEDSARQAANHLMELGHKKIGLIAGTNTYTGLALRDAFIKECVSHGLSESDVPWVEGGDRWSQEEGYEAAGKLLKDHPDITAVMGGNDRLAIGAMAYAASQDIDVPGQLSVMGVDDIPAARFSNPSLTTVQHRLYDLGVLACERLINIFKGEIGQCHEVLPVDLVVRESTGPAKTA
ncbi:MAG: LacI family transcriptional regulator [Verrucomicrobia bacterium]|nr:LacI family transcriptional regulator [Verrucomicrobiota bacterium]